VREGKGGYSPGLCWEHSPRPQYFPKASGPPKVMVRRIDTGHHYVTIDVIIVVRMYTPMQPSIARQWIKNTPM